MIVRSDAADAPASKLSPSSKYKAVFLSITTKVESAGTATVDAILIGEPPDLVIATVASAEFEPSMLATIILFILNTFPDEDAFAKISVVTVVDKSACTDFAVIVDIFTKFGAAIINSFYPKIIDITIDFPFILLKLKFPEPSVVIASSAEPSVLGKVNVKLDAIESDAFNAT